MALRGGGEIEIEGERMPLDADHIARVGAGVNRKVWPGAEGIRLLVIGGVPGERLRGARTISEAGPRTGPDGDLALARSRGSNPGQRRTGKRG